jgi:hypothetical protein
MIRNRSRLPDILILGACLSVAACGAPEQAEAPLGTAQQMMANEVQTTAEVYWESVRFESRLEEDGTVVEEEFEPETDAKWEEVRAAAARLGELGGILQQPAYAEGRGDDWIAFSEGLVAVAAEAEQAAISKDPDAVFAAGGLVYNVCRACHQMYPPSSLPEGVDESELRPSEGVTLEEYVEGT